MQPFLSLNSTGLYKNQLFLTKINIKDNLLVSCERKQIRVISNIEENIAPVKNKT